MVFSFAGSAAVGGALLVILGGAVRTVRAQDNASPPHGAAPEPSATPEASASNTRITTPDVSASNAHLALQAPASAVPQRASLDWNPAWPRFRPIGYWLTGAEVAGALVATFLIPYPEGPRWTGGVLFDNAIRNAVRARNPATRDAIRLASDITLISNIVQVAVVDSLIIPVASGSADTAWQLELMNAQAFALDELISTLLFKVAARARPSYAQCLVNDKFDPLCNSGKYASFPSSHASTAFTAAGLTCVHHAHLPIYGGEPWDTTACVGSLVVASATAAFRVIGDRHYTTDVLLGAALGFSLGYIYPYLFHYDAADGGTASSSSTAAVRWGVVPGAGSGPYGASLAGVF